jgi:hypothetical protein
MDHIVADHLEIQAIEQMSDVSLLAGEKMIEANDILPLGDQPFAEMGAEKSGPRATRMRLSDDGTIKVPRKRSIALAAYRHGD